MRTSATSEDITDWLGAQKPERGPGTGLSACASSEREPASLPPTYDEVDAHQKHRIASASIQLSAPIPASIFDFWLETLMALRGPDILRIKGIVHVEGVDPPFVFHGVQHIFEAPVPLKSWSGTDTTSRVVVIARDMEKADLQMSLDMLRMRQKEVDKPVRGMMADTSEMPF